MLLFQCVTHISIFNDYAWKCRISYLFLIILIIHSLIFSRDIYTPHLQTSVEMKVMGIKSTPSKRSSRKCEVIKSRIFIVMILVLVHFQGILTKWKIKIFSILSFSEISFFEQISVACLKTIQMWFNLKCYTYSLKHKISIKTWRKITT